MSTEYDVQITELKAELAKLRADFKKLKKQVTKLSKDPSEEGVEKPLSGFAKPQKLSEALTAFLGISKETMMARTEVTKEINKYVKANNLQNPENKRELILDDKLRTIIVANEGETVTFFNLQRYMSPHYIKEVKEVVDGKSDAADKVEEKPKPVISEEPKKVKKVIKKVKA